MAATLWRGTAGLDMDQAQQAVDQLGRLRLVTVTGSGITLHDAVRDALREGLGETELARVHGLFLDAAAGDPPQPESPSTPTDTGFVITAAANRRWARRGRIMMAAWIALGLALAAASKMQRQPGGYLGDPPARPQSSQAGMSPR